MATLKGADISHHNGSHCVFDMLSDNNDLQFFMIKATEGRTWIDPELHRNVSDVAESHRLIGFYHYARPENNSAEAEAMHFIDTVVSTGVKFGDFIPVLDFEGVAHTKGGQDWALRWLNAVYESTGVRPLIYMSQSYVKNYPKVAAANYGLWVARYAKEIGDITPWTQQAMWQWTSTGYDKDTFYGSREQWYKYCEVDIPYEDRIPEGSGYCGCCCCKEG